MTITKTFVQKEVSHDCEARDWVWEDTNETYDNLVNKLKTEWNGWFKGARIVEKTFDDETFVITTKMIRWAIRGLDKHYNWEIRENDEMDRRWEEGR